MRGREHILALAYRPCGITPARAGKSSLDDVVDLGEGNYPRSCGEEDFGRLWADFGRELPPLVRGRAKTAGAAVPGVRITPARAGKSTCPHPNARKQRNYPRSCGEEVFHHFISLPVMELPPLVRGRGIPSFHFLTRNGITPARAGKRHERVSGLGMLRNYPRSCGEESPAMGRMWCRRELPPLVRGRDLAGKTNDLIAGITPARAGKSISKAGSGRARRNYPRSCGEEALAVVLEQIAQELPPLVRGRVFRDPDRFV